MTDIYAELFSGEIPGKIDYNLKSEPEKGTLRNEIIKALSFVDCDEIHDYVVAATLEHSTDRFWKDYYDQSLVLPNCTDERISLIDSFLSGFKLIFSNSGCIAFTSLSKDLERILTDENMFNLIVCAVWASIPKENVIIQNCGYKRRFKLSLPP